MIQTVHERTAHKSKVIWTNEENEIIAELVADRCLEDPVTGMLHHLRAVIDEDLSPDRRRVIGSLDQAPKLVPKIVQRFRDKVSHPISIVEVDRPLPPVSELLNRVKTEELRQLLVDRDVEERQKLHEKLESMTSIIEELHSKQAHPVNVSVAVSTHNHHVPMKPVVQLSQKRWQIGISGFSAVQIAEIERKLVHHKNSYDLVVRSVLGQKEQHKLFSSSVDIVIAFRKRIDRSHLRSQMQKLADSIPVKWATNQQEVVDTITDVCIGKISAYSN